MDGRMHQPDDQTRRARELRQECITAERKLWRCFSQTNKGERGHGERQYLAKMGIETIRVGPSVADDGIHDFVDSFREQCRDRAALQELVENSFAHNIESDHFHAAAIKPFANRDSAFTYRTELKLIDGKPP